MRKDFSIRNAETKDAREIFGLIKKEFPYFSIDESELTERLNSKTIVVFKAMAKKSLAGFIELELLDNNEARINGLTIKQRFRNKQAAKNLLSHAIDFLREQGTERVRLLVKQSNNTAKTLYRKFGFEFIGLYHKKLDNDVVEEMELSFLEEKPSYAA